jgi:hypothetical protein
MKVRFSCVIDQHPRFGRQAFVLASSLLTYGGGETDSLVIHTVGEYNGEYKKVFEAWGIETQVVKAFDSRHPNSNKLAQLESQALHSADYVVLLDCDIAFCGDISAWIRGASIRARTASSGGLPPQRWVKVLTAAGLPLPEAWVESVLTKANTLPSYVNGGLYVMPQRLFQQLREVWPRWNRWLLESQELIKPYGEFTDQISFAMSCQELGLTIDQLPLDLNFDTVYVPQWLGTVPGRADILPMVLHYHRFSREGLLRLTKVPSINPQVRKINNLIRLAEQVNFDKPSLMLLRERRVA